MTEICFWCLTECGGTCLGVPNQMKPSDPAYFMLSNSRTSTKTVHSDNCYICNDPEFAQMGLPLCTPCANCGGHVAADDTICDACGADQFELYERKGEM